VAPVKLKEALALHQTFPDIEDHDEVDDERRGVFNQSCDINFFKGSSISILVPAYWQTEA